MSFINMYSKISSNSYKKSPQFSVFGSYSQRTFFTAAFTFKVFGSEKKKQNNRFFHEGYSEFKLLTERNVPIEVVHHRIHGETPAEVAHNGFSGRKDIPQANLKAYVALNMPFPGFGGTVHTEHALDFAKNGANNAKNYLYSSLNPNKKISIPNMLHQEADEVTEPNLKAKISEMEVMVIGDIAPEFILYATDDFDNFSAGKPVKNLMHDCNPDLPETYTKNDVVSPASILLHLARNGKTNVIAEGIHSHIFNGSVIDELVESAESEQVAENLRAFRSKYSI